VHFASLKTFARYFITDLVAAIILPGTKLFLPKANHCVKQRKKADLMNIDKISQTGGAINHNFTTAQSVRTY